MGIEALGIELKRFVPSCIQIVQASGSISFKAVKVDLTQRKLRPGLGFEIVQEFNIDISSF